MHAHCIPRLARGLTLAIPTYRRARLLARMTDQVAAQTLRPDLLLIVDGEGGAPPTEEAARRAAEAGLVVRVIRSTMPNLPFQRYLAWRAARGSRVLVYLDDDLLMPRQDALAKLTAPLREGPPNIAAATAPILSPGEPPKPLRPARRWGASAHAEPGSMTPSGVRIAPAPGRSEVAWLRGGAMAFRTDALSADCFPPTLFALARRGWGMGEDLALARRVVRRGRIVLVEDAVFEHSPSEPSRAVPGGESRRGFAAAYSRRLLNDLCRGDGRPRAGDRAALAKSYLGGIATALRDVRPGYAGGYAVGALAGCFAPPSPRLAADVDWEREAALSLADRGEKAG